VFVKTVKKLKIKYTFRQMTVSLLSVGPGKQGGSIMLHKTKIHTDFHVFL